MKCLNAMTDDTAAYLLLGVEGQSQIHYATRDSNRVTSCPMGHVPVKTTFYPKTGMCRVLFARECSEKYPHREECRARGQKKNYAVHVSANMAERARYLTKVSTDEYKNLTRKRNAMEGIPSVLRRRYHVDDIPVFGYLCSCPWGSTRGHAVRPAKGT